ncbi:MAG TPA: DUF4915 domain-containing protein [Thermoanaerobaculia bacterium]|nr:DUF4915 domain-containing protein [Thermoanaerobaculia bacterium]
MTAASRRPRGDLWARHDVQWRDPAQAAGHWHGAAEVDTGLLAGAARGDWWDVVAQANVTLLVTREYEHLAMAISAAGGRPRVTYWPMPHPSGLAIDRKRGAVYVASTRSPNQVYRFATVAPAPPALPRGRRTPPSDHLVLAPISSSIYPGSLYLHDLAIIGGKLHGNAVGQNSVVALEDNGRYRRVWWPRCVDTRAGPITSRNHLQLNSIAAGRTLRDSYFSASTDVVSARRPGQKNFAVDGRGVIFSGRTREPIARGLTRPHSARLHRRRIWVDNSGYGELGIVSDGRFAPIARLPGWTRGLCFHGDFAFVGTSRVIPEFRQYAPGLDVDRSVCGVHAVDIRSGKVVGSLLWPRGNQVFAVDWTQGALDFPFLATGRVAIDPARLFYSFAIEGRK